MTYISEVSTPRQPGTFKGDIVATREKVINDYAELIVDGMDLKSCAQLCVETIVSNLQECTDEEIIAEIKEYTDGDIITIDR